MTRSANDLLLDALEKLNRNLILEVQRTREENERLQKQVHKLSRAYADLVAEAFGEELRDDRR